MPRSLQAELRSYGIYEPYDGTHIPQIRSFTDQVPAIAGTEFGCVLEISGGRGAVLDWRISHPPFKDRRGRPVPDFSGELHVRTKRYQVFVGDAVWEPVDECCGLWTVAVHHQGRLLVSQAFTVSPP